MNKCIRLLGSLFLVLFCLGNVQAADQMVQLAADKGCFICHSVKPDPKVAKPLAPSYMEIAERYRDRKDAVDYLMYRVLDGTAYSNQNWPEHTSMRFMPPNVNVNREEAAALVHWILRGDSTSESTEKHTEVLALATNSGCMTCHLVDPNHDSRLIPLAPSFRDIANRYADRKDARQKLEKSVLQGTSFQEKTWHNANMRFMPPNPQLRKEDADTLVDWVLSLKHKE